MKNRYSAYVVSFSTYSVAAQLDISKIVRTHTSYRWVEKETYYTQNACNMFKWSYSCANL